MSLTAFIKKFLSPEPPLKEKNVPHIKATVTASSHPGVTLTNIQKMYDESMEQALKQQSIIAWQQQQQQQQMYARQNSLVQQMAQQQAQNPGSGLAGQARPSVHVPMGGAGGGGGYYSGTSTFTSAAPVEPKEKTEKEGTVLKRLLESKI